VTVKAHVGAIEECAGMFLVDTGSMDSVLPATQLRRIGIEPIATESFELADGSVRDFAFGLAQIEVLGKVTAGRVLFGPEGAEGFPTPCSSLPASPGSCCERRGRHPPAPDAAGRAASAPDHHHSMRIAITGSTCAARRAGRNAAASPVTVSTASAPP
jgi:hypothetical protein